MASETKEITACSFCGKPHTEVDKLVAGPGVYICNECYSLMSGIFEGTAETPADIPRGREAVDKGRRALPDDEQLAVLARHARALNQCERDIRMWVGIARERQLDWASIATSLDLTEEEALSRFGKTS